MKKIAEKINKYFEYKVVNFCSYTKVVEIRFDRFDKNEKCFKEYSISFLRSEERKEFEDWNCISSSILRNLVIYKEGKNNGIGFLKKIDEKIKINDKIMTSREFLKKIEDLSEFEFGYYENL